MFDSGNDRLLPRSSTSLDAAEIVVADAEVFKPNGLKLLDQLREHELEVVITRRGEAIARLARYDARSRSAFGFLRGTIVEEEDIVSPDVDSWGDGG